jgi:hypothetical protein
MSVLKVGRDNNLNKLTRREKFGIQSADLLMEAAHQTYNAERGRKMVLACIKRLQTRIKELQPKKATPEYKEARYERRK